MNKIVVIIILFCFVLSGCNQCKVNELSNEKVNNLISFAKLYGYIRYFYPGDMVAKVNWDKFIVYGVKEILNVKGQKELKDELIKLFKPVSPLIEIVPSGTNNYDSIPLNSPNLEKLSSSNYDIICRKHHGVGLGNEAQWKWYYSKRASIKNDTDENFKTVKNYPNPDFKYKFDIGNGLACYFPLSLYTINGKIYPNEDTIKFDDLNSDIEKFSQNDSLINKEYLKTSGVIIFWNIIQHFYPNHEYMKINWENILEQNIRSAYTSTNEYDYFKILKKMSGYLNDGHVQIYSELSIDEAIYVPQINLNWVNDTLFVSDVNEPNLGINKGDIVEGINGLSVEQALEKEEEYITGAKIEWKRSIENNDNSILALLKGKKNSIITLNLIRSRSLEKYTVNLTRNRICNNITQTSKNSYNEIEPGIFYLNLGKISIQEFENILPSLVQSKGIIIDDREYPKKISQSDILAHLINKDILSQKVLIPIVLYPNRLNRVFDTIQNTISPKKPFIKAKFVFISDINSVSANEFYLSFIKHYKLGTIVGESTAGSTGSVNPFFLITAIRFSGQAAKLLIMTIVDLLE